MKIVLFAIFALALSSCGEPQAVAKAPVFQSQILPPSGAVPLPKAGSNFIRMKLQRGVEIDIPKNWWILDKNITALLHTSTEAALDISGIEDPSPNEIDLIRANSLPRSTYATLSITSSPPSQDEFKEIESLIDKNVDGLSAEFRDKILPQMMSAIGQNVVDFYGVSATRVAGHPALVIEYKRTGIKGPVFVQINTIYSNSQIVNLTLSYRESESMMWRPILSRVRQSVAIK